MYYTCEACSGRILPGTKFKCCSDGQGETYFLCETCVQSGHQISNEATQPEQVSAPLHDNKVEQNKRFVIKIVVCAFLLTLGIVLWYQGARQVESMYMHPSDRPSYVLPQYADSVNKMFAAAEQSYNMYTGMKWIGIVLTVVGALGFCGFTYAALRRKYAVHNAGVSESSRQDECAAEEPSLLADNGIANKLRTLDNLRAEHLISEEEYQQQRKRLLESL